MIKLYTASYDATIYLQQPTQNAGSDSILEVGKVFFDGIKDIARTLIKFDVTSLSSSIASNEISGNWAGYLKLVSADSTGLPLNYTIYANPISESWDMGQGTRFDDIVPNLTASFNFQQGVSWRYRNGVNKWQENAIGGTAVYPVGVTGSANAEGGVWYTGSQAEQNFSYQPDDIRMDITNMLKSWISGSITNNGMIIRHSLEVEANEFDYGILRFFSKETHTIYEPKLEVVWNSVSFNTGSLLPVTGSAEEGYKISVTNLKTKYPQNSKIRIRVKGRDIYPQKSFSTTFEYDQSKYLPTSSYYQLEDYVSNQIIYPFSDWTKMSCDSTSNYFDIDLTTLPISRTYLIKLKIEENGVSTIVDRKYLFEIV